MSGWKRVEWCKSLNRAFFGGVMANIFQIGSVAKLIGVISFCTGIYLSVRDMTSSAVTCFSAGILMLMLFSMDKFEFIKGFGFEAKSRVLERKIEEADELMGRLVRVTKIFSHLSTQLMARIGRMNGPIPKRETEALTEEVLSILSVLKVDAAEIAILMKPLHNMNLSDLSHHCLLILRGFVYAREQVCNQEVNELVRRNYGHAGGIDLVPGYLDRINELKELSSYIKKVNEEFNSVDYSDFVGIFTRWVRNLPSSHEEEKDEFLRSMEEDLMEVRYYIDNKKFKNIDKWFDRPYGH
ncbi:hypothetical protein [Chromobacterium sp. ATCC 53434]|uniref:hypothetical protein n=1 Tax=Chromobacterium sp. (strain ATCC 53434 / SC 14030) TaxID=2059672 RepID=UPI0013052FD0|nr:hypothetical protein [Chromobacterium sp. ATCC 53434]